MQIIKKISEYGEQDWKSYLKAATYAYNISYNRNIRTSPLILKNKKNAIIDGKNQFKEILYSNNHNHIDKENGKKRILYEENDIIKVKRNDNRLFNVGDEVLVFSDYK
ncbi:hypothetical protein COBT_002889, partial [Conglomerata obtusa]